MAYSQNVLKFSLIFLNQKFCGFFLFVCVFKATLSFYKNISVHRNLNGNLVSQDLPCCSACFQDKFREEVIKLLFLFAYRNKKTWIWDFPKILKERKGQGPALSNRP